MDGSCAELNDWIIAEILFQLVNEDSTTDPADWHAYWRDVVDIAADADDFIQRAKQHQDVQFVPPSKVDLEMLNVPRRPSRTASPHRRWDFHRGEEDAPELLIFVCTQAFPHWASEPFGGIKCLHVRWLWAAPACDGPTNVWSGRRRRTDQRGRDISAFEVSTKMSSWHRWNEFVALTQKKNVSDSRSSTSATALSPTPTTNCWWHVWQHFSQLQSYRSSRNLPSFCVNL